MARRRWYRRPIRVVAAKKKWASQILRGQIGSEGFSALTLVINSTTASSPTPTMLKCGNFKVQGDVYVDATTTPGIYFSSLFIIYVPEGVPYTDIGDLVNKHPEWIMAWTALDTPVSSTTGNSAGNKFSMSSRLKRNLNSGDRVIMAILHNDAAAVHASFTAQFWTCSN